MELVKVAVLIAVGAVLVALLLAILQPVLRKRLRRTKRRKAPPVHSRGEDTAYTMFDDTPLEEGPDYDPIGEARIHLAYGNREKALGILARAAEASPERQDIRNKLEELKAGGN